MQINKNFIIVLIVIFFNSIGMVLPILCTLFFNDLNFTVKTIGFIMSFFGIGGLIGGYAGGHLSDYVNPKNIVRIALLGNSIFIFFFSILKDSTLFAICMFFTGFFNASFRPPSLMLLFETRGKLKDLKLFSIRRVATNLGLAVASFSFGYLYSYYNKISFIVIGLVFMLAFLFSFFIDTNGKHNEKNLEDISSKKPNFRLFIGLNVLLIFCVIIICQYSSTYTLFLENFIGLSVIDISKLFTFHAVLIILFQIPIAHLFNKITLSMGCLIGSVFLAFGMGFTGFAQNFLLALVFCAIWTLGEIMLPPLILLFIFKISTLKRGQSIGVFQTSIFAGIFLAPLLGSFFYEISPYLLWKLCFVASITCALFFLLLYKFYEKN